MEEIIGELLFRFLVVPVLNFIGAAVRWVFYLGRRRFSHLFASDNNWPVGMLFLFLAFAAPFLYFIIKSNVQHSFGSAWAW